MVSLIKWNESCPPAGGSGAAQWESISKHARGPRFESQHCKVKTDEETLFYCLQIRFVSLAQWLCHRQSINEIAGCQDIR